MAGRYDQIADFYEERTAGDDLVGSAVLELLGDVAGMRLLDLACGHGRLARELARRGAQVVGIDLSLALLDKARAMERAEPLGIRYVHTDAADPDALAGETFDAVSCHFGLTDIDDQRGALTSIARWLRPGGAFVFSLLHPCFPGWGADAPSSWPPGGGYDREGWWLAQNTGFRGKVGASHRKLSTYLNELARHGLLVDRCLEPEPGADWRARQPGADPVPVFLVMRCRGPTGDRRS